MHWVIAMCSSFLITKSAGRECKCRCSFCFDYGGEGFAERVGGLKVLYLIDLSEGVFDFVVESVRTFLDFSGGDRVAVMHEMGVEVGD